MPYFAEYQVTALPVTEDIGKRIVCLPVYSDMSATEQEDILARLEGILL